MGKVVKVVFGTVPEDVVGILLSSIWRLLN